jgi:phage terminase large subunit GpA-like protein
MTGSEWANTYLYLSKEDSAESGKYHTDRAHYQKEILDKLADPRYRVAVCMWASQVGKTLCFKAHQGFNVHQNPIPMLIVQPTIEMAEAYSKDRLATMIRDTPVLRTIFGPAKSRSSKNTIKHKPFPGGHISMAGANSPAGLAGRPVGEVEFDEVDRFPETAGTEGDPCEIGERRLDGWPGGKSIYISSPTDEGTSRIAAKFELTDKRYFFVPCPECNHMQTLEWEQLDCDKEIRNGREAVIESSVRYVCANIDCGARIPEHKKTWMLIHGEWRATATPFRQDYIGWHLNGLYSPFKPWWERISNYLEVKDDPEQLKAFWNTVLARLWRNSTDALDWEKLFARREEYQPNIIPHRASIILAGADVQNDRIELEIRAYGPNMESWGIDYRVLWGPIEKPEVWAQLDAVLEEEFPYSAGGSGKIYRLAIDTGGGSLQTGEGATTIIYNWARRWGVDRVMACKGSSVRKAPLYRAPARIDRTSRGEKLPGAVHLWSIGTDEAKWQINRSLRLNPKVDTEAFAIMHWPTSYREEYFQGLCAEVPVQQRLGRGRVRYIWQKITTTARNESLDINVYLRANAASLGVDRWTELQHEQYYRKRVQARARPAAKKESAKPGPVNAPRSRKVGRPMQF